MSSAHRVLPLAAFASLDAYREAGGGRGLTAARAVESEVLIDELDASGLRGRGGAGFPTGTKWRTVFSYASAVLRTSVVVNAAEGEPGTFKDRSIIRNNPYAVLEGALIAARVVGAGGVTIATKARFTEEVARLRGAIDEIRAAGWTGDVGFDIVEGPGEYLYGEETALLEVLDGRPPFPRIAPPWRRGVVEVVAGDDDVDSGSGLPADVQMATADDGDNLAPPVLVNNVETFANVANIIANGAAWFRSVGTTESPGTILCTVTGAVSRPGVFEVAMGTPLRDLLALATSDAENDGGARSLSAVLMGVSNAILTSAELDTPISYEAFAAQGGGLGSASFIVVDDSTDPVAVAAGASRFLAVESCGQCTPCKQDGLEISSLLQKLASGQADQSHLRRIDERLLRITDGARCSLASQHQVVIGSIRTRFAAQFEARVQPGRDPVEPVLIAEVTAIDGQTTSVDPTFVDKQPDWTYGPHDSGLAPVERLTDHRAQG